MNKRLTWVLCSAVIAVLAGCAQPTAADTGEGTLSGKIRSKDFTFKTGVATSDGDNYSVELVGTSTYPYLNFDLPQDNGTKSYAIPTFGSSSGGKEGIRITGWTSVFDGTFFDSGVLTITKVDRAAGRIEGKFIDAKTTEKTSSLSGGFTVTIH